MRGLTGTLEAAQQGTTAPPYLRVQFVLTGEVNVIFTTADGDPTGSANRILAIDDWEEPYGGACVIRLRNSDQYFKAVDWRGERVYIGYGFVTGEGNEYSESRRVWIINQRDISIEGELVTEFQCVDDWARIASTLLISAGVKLTGTLVNSDAFVLGETITGSVSNATGKLAGVGSNYITVIDVTGTFQTADGGADDADGASASCDALTAVATQSAAGGGLWNKDTTILNILKAILSGLVDDVALDSDDPDNTINTHSPLLILPTGARVRAVVRQLLQMSKCGARISSADDELHVLYLNTAADSVYDYNSDHAFKVDIREEAAILPNQVLFVDQLPSVTGDAPSYFGTAESSARDIGNFLAIEVDPTITSDAEAVKRAEAWIAQREAEAHQGLVVAPMNCGQELYDMVEITDTRADVTVKGRVGRIDRHYSPGRYEITVRLGGILVTPGAMMPGPDAVDWDIKDISTTTPRDDRLITLRKVVYPWQLWKAVQPYVCDIAFTAEDKDTISWTEGTIYFADGSSLTIEANASQDLASAGWLYFTEGSATLTFTASFADCVAPTHGLVAFVAPGAETGQTALVWPAAGKEPLLNADIITCMTLSALTANCGTITAGTIQGVLFKLYGDYFELYDVNGAPELMGYLKSFSTKIELESVSGDIELDAAEDIELYPYTGYVVRCSRTIRGTSTTGAQDLGDDTYYWGEVHYASLHEHSPMRMFKDALDKIKKIKTKVVDGIEVDDKESYPKELVRKITPEIVRRFDKEYEHDMEKYNKTLAEFKERRKVGRGGKRPPIKPEKPIPTPSVCTNDMLGLILSAIKELTERVEQLEAG